MTLTLNDTNDLVPDPREEMLWALLGFAAAIAVVMHYVFK